MGGLAVACGDFAGMRLLTIGLRCSAVWWYMQIQSEFPQILPIKESLIKYVFEPNAAKVSLTNSAVGTVACGFGKGFA